MAARTRTPAVAPRKERRARERTARKVERHPEWVVPALAAVFLVSGSAGLVHEVVWARLLGKLFGASSLAVSTVLAAFMGGLALGSWWMGRRLDVVADRRRTYAWLEIGIGVAALAVPLLLHAVEPIYGALWRRFHLSFAAFSVVRFVVAGVLLLPPTVLMGATLPVLADYLNGLEGRRITPQWLYTANLAGAVGGVALAGFVLMPAIGMWGTIAAGAAINVGAGLVALALPALPARAPATTPAPMPRPALLLLAAALVSGATSIATQVAWTRVLVLIVGSTTYAFSTVLLVYLTALAAGSAWASRRGAGGRDVASLLATAHLALAATLVAAVWTVNRLPVWYVTLFEAWHPESLATLVVMNVALVFVLLFPTVIFAGTILPLVLIGALPASARSTGGVVGSVYAVNTVGAIVGAFAAGFVLLPRVGSQAILLGVAVVAAGLGIAFAATSPARRRLVPAAIGIGALVGAGTVLRPAWHTRELNAAVFEPARLGGVAGLRNTEEEVLYHREGATATVVVAQRGAQRALRINGRVNASDGDIDMPTQVLLAQLPLLLAPRTDDVFILGWGSGITAGAALRAPVGHVTAVELEPAVVEGSRFFAHANHDPLGDPRLRLFQDDARHILAASDDTYDVMISEPSHPWVTGVASLFTRDFFALAASRLRDDGVFAQWLQGYQIPLESFRSILAAFHAVFPEVCVYSPSDADDWIVVGSRHPIRIDFVTLSRKWDDDATRAELARVGMNRPEHLVAGFYLDTEQVRAITAGVPVNTDDNMYVEFSAPRQIAEPRGTSSTRLAAFIAEHVVPAENVLTDPHVVLDDPDRLGALIAGLKRQARPTGIYEMLLAQRGGGQ